MESGFKSLQKGLALNTYHDRSIRNRYGWGGSNFNQAPFDLPPREATRQVNSRGTLLTAKGAPKKPPHIPRLISGRLVVSEAPGFAPARPGRHTWLAQT